MSGGDRVVCNSQFFGLQNTETKNCGQNHIFRPGFLFVATDGDLVGWTDEVDVNRCGGMPYGKGVEEEMVQWAVVYL